MLARAVAASDDRSTILLETGLALAAELSLPALLQRIVELAAELTGARYGALGVLAPDGSGLVDFITTGIGEAERIAIGPLPRGDGILGVLIHEAQPLRLDEIQADPRAVGFPAGHPPMRSFLGAPVRAHGRVFGNVYLTDKRDAAAFTEMDEAALTVLATQAGVAIANARLYEEIRARERWLDAVREVTTTLLAGDPIRTVLELVARRARQLGDADVAAVSVPDGNQLRIVAADGTHAAQLVDVEVELAGSLSAEVIRTGETRRIDDARASHLAQPFVAVAGAGPMILVPMTLQRGGHGILAVGRSRNRAPFGAAQIPLLESFAEQATLALEYARARTEIARLRLVEDRERIARELHDGVIQSLFAVGLGLQGTASVIGDSRLSDRIQQAVGEIDRVIGDLRSYIFGLRPSVLHGGDLSDALEQLAYEFQERTGVTTVIDVDGSLETPLAGVATHVTQMVREALSNVGRHAGARTCRVSLRRDEGAAVLEVDDDGAGFDAESPPRGLGLANLAERAASLSGSFAVESGPERGTTIRVTLPI